MEYLDSILAEYSSTSLSQSRNRKANEKEKAEAEEMTKGYNARANNLRTNKIETKFINSLINQVESHNERLENVSRPAELQASVIMNAQNQKRNNNNNHLLDSFNSSSLKEQTQKIIENTQHLHQLILPNHIMVGGLKSLQPNYHHTHIHNQRVNDNNNFMGKDKQIENDNKHLEEDKDKDKDKAHRARGVALLHAIANEYKIDIIIKPISSNNSINKNNKARQSSSSIQPNQNENVNTNYSPSDTKSNLNYNTIQMHMPNPLETSRPGPSLNPKPNSNPSPSPSASPSPSDCNPSNPAKSGLGAQDPKSSPSVNDRQVTSSKRKQIELNERTKQGNAINTFSASDNRHHDVLSKGFTNPINQNSRNKNGKGGPLIYVPPPKRIKKQ